jgi:hypothetical protein
VVADRENFTSEGSWEYGITKPCRICSQSQKDCNRVLADEGTILGMLLQVHKVDVWHQNPHWTFETRSMFPRSQTSREFTTHSMVLQTQLVRLISNYLEGAVITWFQCRESSYYSPGSWNQAIWPQAAVHEQHKLLVCTWKAREHLIMDNARTWGCIATAI